MNYSIIRNKEWLEDYIASELCDLESGELYYIRLITRSKYVNGIRNDYDLRSIIVRDRGKIIENIKRLECELGSYNGLGEDDLAIYITPNPRGNDIGLRNLFLELSWMVGREGYCLEDVMYHNIRRSCSRKLYFDCDYDCKDVDMVIEEFKRYINHDCVRVMRTKGGVHFIIKISDIDLNRYSGWYDNIKLIRGYDMMQSSGDNMIPIVGCSQFGYVPYLEELKNG